MKILVTGAAGFIGFHLSRRLLADGHRVVGLDNLNDYYDVKLKSDRIANLTDNESFRFIKLDIAERAGMENLFADHRFDRVFNLAAQPGVRYSLTHPHRYVSSNVVGFTNVLEGCRHQQTPHLVFASSSSVYGLNTRMPFSVSDNVDHPISLYAATKKANELMAHTYSYLYGLAATGLRFFTVYGPWGRPDMAYFLFTQSILENRPIKVFNHGRMKRDFTYIDDIVESLVRVMNRIPGPDPNWDRSQPDPAGSSAPFRLFNIGQSNPVDLMEFIATLETALGRKAEKVFLPLQPGDVPETHAHTADLESVIEFKPSITIREGIPKFISWYLDYYQERPQS